MGGLEVGWSTGTAGRCSRSTAISFQVNCETQQEVDDLLGEALRRRRRASAVGSRTATGCPGRSCGFMPVWGVPGSSTSSKSRANVIDPPIHPCG
jgi:hypothetical protein